MRIEIGKTYVTRDGKHRVTIDETDMGWAIGEPKPPIEEGSDPYATGFSSRPNRHGWRVGNGSWSSAGDVELPHDLVAEIVEPAVTGNSVQHADLIRALLDGKTVQRTVATIRGGDQTWDYQDYTDPVCAIEDLLRPTAHVKYRVKPEPVDFWGVVDKDALGMDVPWFSGMTPEEARACAKSQIADGKTHARVFYVAFDPDTLDVIDARTEAP